MNDQKNTILAIVLSAIVLIGWQYFIGMPQMERQRQEQLLKQQQQQTQAQPPQAAPNAAPAPQARRAAPTRPGRRDDAGGTEEPRGGAGRKRAHPHRYAGDQGFDRPQGRAHRRHFAGPVSRDGRPEIAGHRAAVAVRQPASVLCGIRLGRRRRRQCEGAGAGYRMAARGRGVARAGTADRARLRQWRGAEVPPHHRRRRQVSVHLEGRGGQQRRRAGDALSLCAGLAPRPAADVRLLHPARGHDRRDGGSGPAGGHLQDDRRQEEPRLQGDRCLDGHHRQILGRDAAAEHRCPGPGAFFRQPRPAA